MHLGPSHSRVEGLGFRASDPEVVERRLAVAAVRGLVHLSLGPEGVRL
jgi:hypothetical protein